MILSIAISLASVFFLILKIIHDMIFIKAQLIENLQSLN